MIYIEMGRLKIQYKLIHDPWPGTRANHRVGVTLRLRDSAC